MLLDQVPPVGPEHDSGIIILDDPDIMPCHGRGNWRGMRSSNAHGAHNGLSLAPSHAATRHAPPQQELHLDLAEAPERTRVAIVHLRHGSTRALHGATHSPWQPRQPIAAAQSHIVCRLAPSSIGALHPKACGAGGLETRLNPAGWRRRAWPAEACVAVPMPRRCTGRVLTQSGERHLQPHVRGPGTACGPTTVCPHVHPGTTGTTTASVLPTRTCTRATGRAWIGIP